MKSEYLYRKALNTWGQLAQIDMAVEECAELIKALCKWKRGLDNETVDPLLEEMADVEIMLEQLKMIYNYKYSNGAIDKFKDIKRQKLERLEKRLE